MKKSTRRSFLSITDDDPCHRLLAKAFSRQQNVELKCSAWKTHFSLFLSQHSSGLPWKVHELSLAKLSKKKQHNNTMEHNPCFKKWWKMLAFDCRLLYTHTRQIYMVINRLSGGSQYMTFDGFDADNSSTAQQSDCFFCTYTQRVTYNKLPTVCGKSSKK